MSDFLGNLSVKISHQLNLSGFWTRKESRRSEILLLDHIDETKQLAGSLAEGTEIEGSDKDIMLIHLYATVVTNKKQKTDIPKNKVALLMCQDGFRPCYPILEVLTPQRHLQSVDENTHNVLNFVTTIQKDDRCIKCVSSKAFLEESQRIESKGKHINKQWELTLNGPSNTAIGPHMNCDSVFVIPCCKWPPIASEWVNRERKNQWPDRDLIERVVKTNCGLAPIGDQFSEHKDVQWRFSFTRGKCHLIWSLNRQQFCCLYVLKGLIKRFFQEKPISSFMLKTTFFWYMEDTDQNLWVDENFLVCIQQCLQKLIGFIKAGSMPHFFVRKNNIIMNRFNSEETEYLSVVLDFISTNIDIFIFEAPSISLRCLSYPDNLYFLHQEIEGMCDDPVYCDMEIFVDCLNKINMDKSSYILEDHIDLSRRILFRKLANEYSSFYCNYYNMLTRVEKTNILHNVEECYKTIAEVRPTSGHLILATFYLWQENLNELRNLLKTLDVKTISRHCGPCSYWKYVSLKENDMFVHTCVFDVRINTFDKHFMPGIISCELEYFSNVHIYPPVYLQFIKFLLAKAEGNKEHQLEALRLLSSVIETMNG